MDNVILSCAQFIFWVNPTKIEEAEFRSTAEGGGDREGMQRIVESVSDKMNHTLCGL